MSTSNKHFVWVNRQEYIEKLVKEIIEFLHSSKFGESIFLNISDEVDLSTVFKIDKYTVSIRGRNTDCSSEALYCNKLDKEIEIRKINDKIIINLFRARTNVERLHEIDCRNFDYPDDMLMGKFQTELSLSQKTNLMDIIVHICVKICRNCSIYCINVEKTVMNSEWSVPKIVKF
jgi:hypothetical protein